MENKEVTKEEALKAYNYYCESRRRNNHEPIEFYKWKKMVTDNQIKDMVKLYKL